MILREIKWEKIKYNSGEMDISERRIGYLGATRLMQLFFVG